MNIYYLIAGLLCFILGIVHSFLGEYLIFNQKRNSGKLVPSIAGKTLKERHLRIIWATWHLASVFGGCIGIVILKMAWIQEICDVSIASFIIKTVIYSMLLASLLVLVGTRGKHPGWIVLLLIAILLIIGS